VLAVSLPLAACSSGDWDYLTSFGSTPDDEEVVAEAPQTPTQSARQTASSAPRQVASGPAAAPGQAPAMDPWCSQVMTADVAMAQRNGLDQATQQRMAVTSYRQCLAIFTNAN
jgi:3-oxoacyl-ACP reductase-like protein